MAFLNILPSAVSEGIIWGLMAIGVYISYKILDIADLTVDGSVCTGACVFVVTFAAGMPVWACMLIAFLVGALTGVVTGLLHTVLGIPAILAGILTQLMLHTTNLLILGNKSVFPIENAREAGLLLHMSNNNHAVLTAGIIAAVTIIALWLFFYTEVGLTIKSTGDNSDMSRAQGVNVNFNKVLGLAISNGIVALSGSLWAQYQGSANLDVGRGAIVIGLAAIFIGLSVSMKIKPNFVVSLIGVIFGGIVYRVIFNYVLLMDLSTEYLKMFSAIVVVIFLAVPYLKNTYFKKQKPIMIESTEASADKGGEVDA